MWVITNRRVGGVLRADHRAPRWAVSVCTNIQPKLISISTLSSISGAYENKKTQKKKKQKKKKNKKKKNQKTQKTYDDDLPESKGDYVLNDVHPSQ